MRMQKVSCTVVVFLWCSLILFSSFGFAENVNDDDLVFIHHSCGKNWLNDGLHDALLAKDYIDERNDIYYNTDLEPDSNRPDSLGPTPGDNTNMNHWILWFNDYLESVKQFDCTDGYNKIIMFKSCYPISNIVSDGTEPGDPFSSTQTIANYKAVYRKYNGGTYTHNDYTYYPLEDIFASNPDILFIPVTAPPRHYAPSDATNDAEAHRTYVFNNWLKNDWLTEYNTNNPDLNNVAVYDWFDVLTYSDIHQDYPNRLKNEYGGESGNSHPNTLANQESTQDFATNTPNFIETAWNTFETTNPVTWNISVYPESQNVALNSYVEIDIIANHTSVVDPVSGWEIRVLNFSSSHVSLNSVTEGNWLRNQGSTSFYEGTIKNSSGNVSNIYCFTLGDNTTNDGVLCTLNFTTNKTGIVEIYYSIGLSFEGESVSYFSKPGIIQIMNGETGNTAPVLYNPSPSNSTTSKLSYRTSQTWSISITDAEGDNLSGMIKSNDQTAVFEGGNDTYGIYLTKLHPGVTRVDVEVTDGTSWTKEWFQFAIAKKESSDQSNDNTDTPGFDSVLVITCLGVLLFVFRKRKESRKK